MTEFHVPSSRFHVINPYFNILETFNFKLETELDKES